MRRIKRFLKVVFCQCVYYGGLFHWYIRLVFLRKKDFGAVIINYHRFVESLESQLETKSTVVHRIEDFRREIRFLKRYFHIASLDEVAQNLREGKRFKQPTVALTIDDGWRDNYELLFPVLKKENVPATIFLTAGVIGTDRQMWFHRLSEVMRRTKKQVLFLNGRLHKKTYFLNSLNKRRRAYIAILQELKDVDIGERDRYLSEIENQLGRIANAIPVMLDWSQVRAMHKQGVSFGAHSCTHPILTNMPLEDAKKEIIESKRIIENKLEEPVNHFAYPNGRPKDFNEELRKFCQQSGFQSICSCDYGHNRYAADVWSLKRIGSEVPIGLFAANVVRSFYL